MKCSAITRGGTPCRAQTLPDDKGCFAHSSRADVITARVAGRKDGGTSRGKQLSTRSVPEPPGFQDLELLTEADCEDLIREITLAALRGTLSTRDAAAKTKLVLALARAIRSSEKSSREDQEFARRMRR